MYAFCQELCNIRDRKNKVTLEIVEKTFHPISNLLIKHFLKEKNSDILLLHYGDQKTFNIRYMVIHGHQTLYFYGGLSLEKIIYMDGKKYRHAPTAG